MCEKLNLTFLRYKTHEVSSDVGVCTDEGPTGTDGRSLAHEPVPWQTPPDPPRPPAPACWDGTGACPMERPVDADRGLDGAGNTARALGAGCRRGRRGCEQGRGSGCSMAGGSRGPRAPGPQGSPRVAGTSSAWKALRPVPGCAAHGGSRAPVPPARQSPVPWPRPRPRVRPERAALPGARPALSRSAWPLGRLPAAVETPHTSTAVGASGCPVVGGAGAAQVPGAGGRGAPAVLCGDGPTRLSRAVAPLLCPRRRRGVLWRQGPERGVDRLGVGALGAAPGGGRITPWSPWVPWVPGSMPQASSC